LLLSIKNGTMLKPLALIIFLTVSLILVSGLIFWGAPRFRVTIAPFLLIYVALGLGFVYGRIKEYMHSLRNIKKELLNDTADLM